MSIEIDTRDAPRLLRITFSNQWPSRAEQLQIRQQLLADGIVDASTRVLIDLRPLGGLAPPFEEVGPRVSTDAAVAKPGVLPTHTAYVVGSAVHLGLVDQLKAYAPPHMKIDAFTREDQALSWLNTP